jgi:hypothetical protein
MLWFLGFFLIANVAAWSFLKLEEFDTLVVWIKNIKQGQLICFAKWANLLALGIILKWHSEIAAFVVGSAILALCFFYALYLEKNPPNKRDWL